MKDRLKPLFPHLIALVIFLLVGCIYFMPALKGYRLFQSDMKQAAGMVQEAKSVKAETGKEVYWTNSMFSGMPTTQISADFDGDYIRYVHEFIQQKLPQPIGIWIMYALGFYILLLSLQVNRWLSIVGGLAFAFSTYFIIIIEVGHVTKAWAIGYLPLVVAGFIWTYRGKYRLGAIVCAVGMALECYANHVQVTYYMVFLLLFLGIAQLVEAVKGNALPNFFKASAIVVFSLAIGVMVNFGNLYNTYVYGKYTNRGASELTIKGDGTSNKDIATSGLDREYVTDYSYGIDESWTFLVPNTKGGATKAIGPDNPALKKADPQFQQNIAQSNNYWGDQLSTAGPVYIGAGVCLLFVLGMFFLQGAMRWALLAGAFLALMLGWGKNFMGFTNFFLDHVPGYAKFRAVTIILVIVELCLPIIGFLFVNDLIANPDKYAAQKKKLLYISGSLVALLLVFWAIPAELFEFISKGEQDGLGAQASQNPEMAATVQQYINSLKEVRIAIFKSDVLRSLFFVVATAGVVYAAAIKALKPTLVITILGALVLLDLVPVNKRYLSNEKINGQYANWEKVEENKTAFIPSPSDLEILARELQQKPELVAEINQKLEKKKQEKQSRGQVPILDESEIADIQFQTLNSKTNYRVFNQTVSTFSDASTSYFHKSIGGYHGAKLKRYLEIIEFHFSRGISMPVINMLNTKYVITQNGVQENPSACGNAWFVKGSVLVNSADEEIQALKDFNPKATAIVDKRFKNELKPFRLDTLGSIRLKSYSPDELVYESNASSQQLAVFSEIYYEAGWNAYVDGKKVPHFRTDYVLRGMIVPAGKHTIDFKFEQESVKIGEAVSYAGSILLILIIGITVITGLRNKNKKEMEVA